MLMKVSFNLSNEKQLLLLIFISVIDDGDTKEDAEAKALLNKFFGASALMTTIESGSGLSKDYLSTGGAKNKTVRK